MQRLSLLAVGLCVVLAGCSGGLGGATSATGQVQVYLSDSAAAMDDFQSVNVTVEKAVLVRADGGGHHSGCQHGCGGGHHEDNTTDQRVVLDANGATVDLTEYQGANATRILATQVSNGTYEKAVLVLDGVNATLDNGSQADVDAPHRVVVSQEFTVHGNQTDLVYDLAVHGNPGNYTLRLNETASGPHGHCQDGQCHCDCGH